MTDRPRVVTDFRRDLEQSKDDEEIDVVQAAIHRHFPTHLANYPAHNTNDRAGVDRWVELPKGVMAGVDLKIRKKDFQWGRGPMDVGIEIAYGSSPGWSMKPTCARHFLVVCKDTGRSAMFDAFALLLAVAENIETWRQRYGVKENWTADPDGRPVKCLVVFVPETVVAAACEGVMGDWW